MEIEKINEKQKTAAESKKALEQEIKFLENRKNLRLQRFDEEFAKIQLDGTNLESDNANYRVYQHEHAKEEVLEQRKAIEEEFEEKKKDLSDKIKEEKNTIKLCIQYKSLQTRIKKLETSKEALLEGLEESKKLYLENLEKSKKPLIEELGKKSAEISKQVRENGMVDPMLKVEMNEIQAKLDEMESKVDEVNIETQSKINEIDSKIKSSKERCTKIEKELGIDEKIEEPLGQGIKSASIPARETDVTTEELNMQKDLRKSISQYIEEAETHIKKNKNSSEEKNKISIKMGRKAQITIGGQTFKSSRKAAKMGLYMSENELIEKMRKCVSTSTIKNIIDPARDIEEYMKQGIIDTTIINSVLEAKNLSFGDKSKIIENYCIECMDSKETKSVEVVYDLKDLSKENILLKLFKNEVNNKEKFEMMKNATMAERCGIGKKEGTYKPNIISRLLSKITKDPIKQIASREDEQEAATLYNKLLDEGKTNKTKDNKFISELQVSDQVKQELVELGKSMDEQKEEQQTEQEENIK